MKGSLQLLLFLLCAAWYANSFLLSMTSTSAVEQSHMMPRRGRGRPIQKPQPASALCYPQRTRPRGCDFDGSFIDPGQLLPLPCVQNGTCPYAMFRCSRGHEWKAVPGSPVCFQCPQCKPSNGSRGRTRSTSASGAVHGSHDALLASLIALAERKGGHCLSSSIRGVKDKALFSCKEGHIWEATPANLLATDSWCRKCWQLQRSLKEDNLQETAAYFGGEWLRVVEEDISRIPSQRRHVWRCKEGHEFVQVPNNIRRRVNTKRSCSWCPTCIKAGAVFRWDPPASTRRKAPRLNLGEVRGTTELTPTTTEADVARSIHSSSSPIE